MPELRTGEYRPTSTTTSVTIFVEKAQDFVSTDMSVKVAINSIVYFFQYTDTPGSAHSFLSSLTETKRLKHRTIKHTPRLKGHVREALVLEVLGKLLSSEHKYRRQTCYSHDTPISVIYLS